MEYAVLFFPRHKKLRHVNFVCAIKGGYGMAWITETRISHVMQRRVYHYDSERVFEAFSQTAISQRIYSRKAEAKLYGGL